MTSVIMALQLQLTECEKKFKMATCNKSALKYLRKSQELKERIKKLTENENNH